AMFHAQILTNLLDYGMDPQEAIERPRFVIGDVVGLSPLPAPELMDTVHLENRVPKRVFTGLARKGHPVKPAPALFTRAGQAGAQSPRGLAKLTIDFGLLTPQGYKPLIVRVMELLPKPGVFTRQTVTLGWGVPQGIKTEDGIESVFYQTGLIVRFDKDGWLVT